MKPSQNAPVVQIALPYQAGVSSEGNSMDEFFQKFDRSPSIKPFPFPKRTNAMNKEELKSIVGTCDTGEELQERAAIDMQRAKQKLMEKAYREMAVILTDTLTTSTMADKHDRLIEIVNNTDNAIFNLYTDYEAKWRS
jgi:hypothetical protein